MITKLITTIIVSLTILATIFSGVILDIIMCPNILNLMDGIRFCVFSINSIALGIICISYYINKKFEL